MRRWSSIIVIIIPIIILFFVDYNGNFDDQAYDKLKDQVELISWIFSGIVSFAGFFGLFIGFIYDNKLITAAKDLRQFFRPYALNTNDIRLFLSNYQQLTSGDKLLRNIYWIYLILTCSTIFVWGASVGFYTKFQVSFKLDLSIAAIINFGIYLFMLVLFGLLIYVTFTLNQIRHLKDPLDKGYMPNVKYICDIDYLNNYAEVDIDEMLFKLSPSLEFYKNPPVEKPTYEIDFHLPLIMKNFRFTLKLISSSKEGKEIVIRCYGKLNNFNIVGDKFTAILDNDLSEPCYNNFLNISEYGEFKLYNNANDVISRFNMIKIKESESSFKFILDKSIRHPENKDLDKGLLSRVKENEVKYHIEYEKEI